MFISTIYLERCLTTLDSSLQKLKECQEDTIDYEVYRNAVIKGFELTLETAGKLLRKALKAYGGSPQEIDKFPYIEVFRRAAKHGLVDIDFVERWIVYRLNRNNTAHDYGIDFARETLRLLPNFVNDAKILSQALKDCFGDENA